MWDNWIGRRIRESNRSRAMWGCLALALFAGHAYWLRATLNDLRAGPLPITLDELAQVEKPDGLNFSYVTFDAGQLADTGFRLGKWQDRYLLGRAGGGVFLVLVPSSHADGPVTGFIRRMHSEDRSVRDAIENDVPALQGAFLPLVIDTTRREYVGLWARFAVLMPTLGLVIWVFAFAVWRSLDPLRHPIARALARFGNPAEMAARIQEEAGVAAPLRFGPIEVVGGWVLCRHFWNGYQIFRMEELVSVSKDISTLYAIFTDCWLEIKDRTGVEFSVNPSASQMEQFLALISARARWVIIRDQ